MSADEFDVDTRRGKAIAEATAPAPERKSDAEAFQAFALAVKMAIVNKAGQGSNDLPTFEFADGRGVLNKGGHKKVIFYLNYGILVAKVHPFPSPLVVPYVRRQQGSLLNWYSFAMKESVLNELQLANEFIAIAL